MAPSTYHLIRFSFNHISYFNIGAYNGREHSMIDYHINWSIYVQARSIQKVQSTHLPAIEKLIGSPQPNWLIQANEAGDGQTRLTMINNHSADTASEAVLHVLSLAGQLAGNWKVNGLQLLNQDGYLHVTAHRLWSTPLPKPPALTDVLIEAEQGVYPRNI